MTNVEKADSIGILDDLRENYTDEFINTMTPREFLNAWLEWEGIIGFTHDILKIVDLFYELKKEEPIVPDRKGKIEYLKEHGWKHKIKTDNLENIPEKCLDSLFSICFKKEECNEFIK